MYCMIQQQLEPQFIDLDGLPLAVTVTVAINFYASAAFQESSGDLSGISQSAAHSSIKAVTNSLLPHVADYINFPIDLTSHLQKATAFSQLAGFPQVLGVTDYTNVPIQHADTFFNQRSFHSINLQVVCGHKKISLQVCAKFLAAAFVLRSSQLPQLFQPPKLIHGLILGDKGCPVRTWIFIPFKSSEMEAQSNYNSSYIITRSTIIEQATGFRRICFKCFYCSRGSLQYTTASVSRIVVVCCMLYNFVQWRGLQIDDDDTMGRAPPSEEEDYEEDDDDKEAAVHLKVSKMVEGEEATNGRASGRHDHVTRVEAV
ncbi:putative nuclease HARBI1 [Carcharodon carcharias]|uniref:putative nuclease HARBI1 n=1 Tax=Carcharodon carcharias TaxID=13397 RepID=UPI001B7EB22C|nr:putative nuclease HARBI1 [Carcharodon carcharias]